MPARRWFAFCHLLFIVCGQRSQAIQAQEKLAAWLRIPRSSVALAELYYQPWPGGTGTQDARLVLASLGLVYDGVGNSQPGPPPLAPPPPEAGPLADRLRQCRHQICLLQHQLLQLQQRAAPYEARLAALPALRAYSGPVENPDHEARWLDDFEAEALEQLRWHCGAAAQGLLKARLTGLQREAELLAELLSPLSKE